MKNPIAKIFAALFLLTTAIQAQTYTLEQTAIAGGGISNGAGGVYGLSATTGQTAAGGALRGSSLAMTVGFWNPDALAPTAANVSIGGRVVTADGRGIGNARLVLTDGSGAVRETRTGSFGFYQFADVPIGATYVLTVYSTRYAFDEPTRVFSLSDELTGVDFTSAP